MRLKLLRIIQHKSPPKNIHITITDFPDKSTTKAPLETTLFSSNSSLRKGSEATSRVRLAPHSFFSESIKHYHKYISIASGVALIVSETLPFTDSKFNGIFHTLHTILLENNK